MKYELHENGEMQVWLLPTSSLHQAWLTEMCERADMGRSVRIRKAMNGHGEMVFVIAVDK